MKVSCLSAAAAALALTAASSVQAQPAAGGSAATASRAGDHLLKLTNSGGQGISAMYFAAPGRLEWSDDLLGKQVAGPGRTVSVKIKDPKGSCVFDLVFLMANGDTITKSAVNVCDQPAYAFAR